MQRGLVLLFFVVAACSDGGLDPIRDGRDGLLFFDDFEYDVARDDVGARPLFIEWGGWTDVRTGQSGGSPNGLLYTSVVVDGSTEPFPGQASQRVLVMEALAGAGQADLYMQYGPRAGQPHFIPGDVWFQFWIYPAATTAQPSLFGATSSTLLSPCCGDYHWNLAAGSRTFQPFDVEPQGDPSSGHAYLRVDDSTLDSISYAPAPPADAGKLGQTNLNEHLAANRWTLVKLHLDTSTPSGQFEAWVHKPGKPFVKVAEWIDGVTPELRWAVPSAQVGGHPAIRFPMSASDYDTWVYVDDFAIATREDALPAY